MFPVFSTPCFDSGYIFGVSLRLLLEEFVFLRDGEPGSRGRGSHLEIRTLFQQAALMTSVMGFCRVKWHFSRSSSFLELSARGHFSSPR